MLWQRFTTVDHRPDETEQFRKNSRYIKKRWKVEEEKEERKNEREKGKNKSES